MSRRRRADDSVDEIFVEELPESFQLCRRKGIECAEGRRGTFLKINLKIVWTMRREAVGLDLIEDICKLVVFWRNTGEVDRGRASGGGTKVSTFGNMQNTKLD